MNLADLSIACPGVDFTDPHKSYNPSFSIGDYVMKYLQKTFGIIKSSPTIENGTIVEFVRAGIKHHRLPYTSIQLVENLKCSAKYADHFLQAQSAIFAVTFQPVEFKTLCPCDSVPYVTDSQRKLRTGGYGVLNSRGWKATAKKDDCASRKWSASVAEHFRFSIR